LIVVGVCCEHFLWYIEGEEMKDIAKNLLKMT